jgi:hypothetical protein
MDIDFTMSSCTKLNTDLYVGNILCPNIWFQKVDITFLCRKYYRNEDQIGLVTLRKLAMTEYHDQTQMCKQL